MNEHVDYVSKQPTKANKFFWWCAGVDKNDFESVNSSDARKKLKLGILIFIIGIITAISTGLGIYNTLHQFAPTILIAFISLLTVIILDRTLVSMLGDGDGTSNITFKEFSTAVPGFLIAIVLGFIISAPIETVIFDSEIQREWTDTKMQLVKKSVYDISDIYASRQNEYEKSLEAKNKEIIAADEEVKTQMERVTRERQAGTGPQWQKDVIKQEELQATANFLRQESDSIEASINNLLILKIRDEDSAKAEIVKLPAGLLDKILMLEKLTSDGNLIPKIDPTTNKPQTLPNGTIEQVEIVSSAFWPIWLLRLVFICLHTSLMFPIFLNKNKIKRIAS